MRSRLPAAAALLPAAIPAAAALDGGLLRRTQAGIRSQRRLDWKELRQDEPTGECSCSPMAYTFRLDASNDCATNDLDGRPGIGNALCVQESGTNPFENAGVPYDDIEVTSITFLEFDPSVASALNADDRYATTSLNNGDAFAFDSISKELDPTLPLEEQAEYVPGGVQLLLTGRATVDGEEREVTNRVTWSYTNACDVAPLEGGERIGWVTLVAIEPASGACKATATTTTVTATSATTSSTEMEMTSSTVLTTEKPETTSSTVVTTTEEPATTAAATSPAATTEKPIETTASTSVATSTSTTTEATAIVTTTEAPSFDVCVCSPRSYTMKLDLWYLCNEDDLESNDGIGLTLCVVLDGETDEDDSRRLATTLSQQQLDQVEIYDIQILEFGAQGELTVISQEDLQVPLMNGDSFSFDSISADLNADLPLGEQADLVPGGVQLTMRGRVDVTTEDGSAEERTINQRVTWSYTNDCVGTLPVTEGNTIGWVTFEILEDPASDFCPIAPTPTTTTTSTTTTVAVTSEPTAKPTAKPTPYPTPEMSMVAKSAKSKSSKESDAFAHAKTGKATYDDEDGKKSKAAKMFKGSSGKSGKHASGKSEKDGGESGWGDGGTSAMDGRAKRLFPKRHHRLAG